MLSRKSNDTKLPILEIDGELSCKELTVFEQRCLSAIKLGRDTFKELASLINAIDENDREPEDSELLTIAEEGMKAVDDFLAGEAFK